MSDANQSLMTSLELVKITGKRHDNIIRDIERLSNSVRKHESFHLKEIAYVNTRGRTYRGFEMDNETAKLLLDRYNGLARVPLRLQEEAALKTIEQLLGVSLIRQFKCLSYRIDGYDPVNNVAYEIDEPAHEHKQKQDANRQREIENAIGCRFVRIKL